MKKFKIAVSVGDVHGIGLEVLFKALSEPQLSQSFESIIICAHQELVKEYFQAISEERLYSSVLRSKTIGFYSPSEVYNGNLQLGNISKESGRYALASFELAMHLAEIGEVDGIVTAPISKESINLASESHIPGHTELLAQKFGSGNELMILANQGLRVALVTGHVPIAQISSVLNEELILKKARILNQSLKNDFGIQSPSIAVLALNPHAGDGGVIGTEEIDIITPAIQKLESEQINVEGPFPADGFFGSLGYQDFDGILAMYHDQGLIPFKALSFGKGVNITAGLSVVRTSPDHGTAFSLVGKNLADHRSFLQSLLLAKEILENRKTRL